MPETLQRTCPRTTRDPTLRDEYARAALAFAANPADIHAGLLLRTLGPDPLPLQEALSAQMEGRLVDDPVLMRLAALSNLLARLPVGAALSILFFLILKGIFA